MRKVINNRLYDTGTARLVGSHQAEVDGGSYVFGDLYRKRTSEYFVETSGTLVGMERTITPLSYDEAREWAESHLTAEEYEAEFGPVSEGGGDEVVSARVSAAAKRALEREAQRTGETQTAILERLLLSLAGE
ncbi:hypothetical protein [Olsenella profusa]|uniref:Uncharacterized protein n=1 Tax=Olsenella profusa F0195 TaxID=1125712 RepID=U2TTY5_9ACTN|nr:hypothetical protein [Olsenella profusa]ERL09800.1 hypothetical protein HMPREF1316_1500 [Olsenella profusa F0195]